MAVLKDASLKKKKAKRDYGTRLSELLSVRDREDEIMTIFPISDILLWEEFGLLLD